MLSNTFTMNKMTSVRLSFLRVTPLWLVLAWSACQKAELPPTVIEPTIFSVRDTLNKINLTAGIDRIYLYARTDRDAQQISVFSGTFSEENCLPAAACPGSMRFEFRNLNPDVTVFPEEVFREGERQYADQSSAVFDSIYRTTFVAPAGYASYNWVLDSVDKRSGQVVVKDFQSADPVKVVLSMSGGNLPVTIRRTVSISGKETFPAVQIGIERGGTSDSIYLIHAKSSGLPIIQYRWFPDTIQVEQEYQTMKLENQYAVTVTDNMGNTASVQVDSVFAVSQSFSSSDFTYNVQPTVTGDPFQLGRVAIQWVDQQGVVWRSDRSKQTGGAYFLVTSGEPYEPNETGQKTYKMNVQYRCTLYNPLFQGRDFQGSAVIAVAY